MKPCSSPRFEVERLADEVRREDKKVACLVHTERCARDRLVAILFAGGAGDAGDEAVAVLHAASRAAALAENRADNARRVAEIAAYRVSIARRINRK